MIEIKNIYGEVIERFPELDSLVAANLSYHDLMFADFRGMDVSDVNFEGADLYGAEFDDWVLDGSNLNPPNFTDTYYEVVMDHGGYGHHTHIRGY